MSQETIKICQYCGTDHSQHHLGASYACGPEKYHHLRIEDWPDGTRPFDLPGQGGQKAIEIKDLQRVRLAKGDVLAVRLKQWVHPEELERMNSYLKAFFPDNDILVMNRDVDLAVICQDEQHD